MARIYQDVCTIHLEHDEIVAITGDELFGFNGDWFTFGVCKECRDTISIAEFEAFVYEHGVKMKDGELPPGMKVKKPKAAKVKAPAQAAHAQPELLDGQEPETSPCLWCPQHSTSESGVLQHIRARHGFKGSRDSYGTVCPLCGEGHGVLAQHTQKAHGLTLSHAFIQARDLGDPHNVVADALARLP